MEVPQINHYYKIIIFFGNLKKKHIQDGRENGRGLNQGCPVSINNKWGSTMPFLKVYRTREKQLLSAMLALAAERSNVSVHYPKRRRNKK